MGLVLASVGFRLGKIFSSSLSSSQSRYFTGPKGSSLFMNVMEYSFPFLIMVCVPIVVQVIAAFPGKGFLEEPPQADGTPDDQSCLGSEIDTFIK
jgi:hypothetical protein